MRNIDPTLATHLGATNAYLLADLYTVRLGGRSGSTVYRWTSADVNVTVGGQVYYATSTAITRGRVRQSLELEVDSLDLTFNVASGALTLNGLPFTKAALDGQLDGAYVTLQRCWLTNWTTPVGAIVLFGGTVASVKPSSTTVEVSVKSDVALMERSVPSTTFQPQCAYQVYSDGCGLNRADYTETTTVDEGSTATVINCASEVSIISGWVIGSGDNAGLRRMIRSVEDKLVLTLATPFPNAPTTGDSLSIIKGCDKTRATCKDTFNNITRFRGFPDVPPETQAS